MIRQPICVLLAHVDHGKTSILDWIRGTSVADGEAGGITQNITAHSVELEKVKNICGPLLDQLNLDFTIPGILFVDSPGHEAFTSLRKRGGNIADIAILVIDINDGIKPQTLEAIEILKQYQTPFVIAANKIDRMGGWRSTEEKKNVLKNIQEQSSKTMEILDTKLYEIVGKLAEQGINSERFDRVQDYTKQISIIPTSAKTGEGLPELMMVISGLAQKYLEENLETNVSGPGKATVLEITEEKGIGATMDTIIYDGTIKQGDTIVIGGIEEPTVTKIKSLFKYEKNKLVSVKQITAAAGVKISAPGIEDVVPGMPLRVANENLETIKEEIQAGIEEVTIETETEGIILKADTLGSLEALIHLLKDINIKIKKASIGPITKKDIVSAESGEDPLNRVILGFNVEQLEKAEENAKIIKSPIVYKLIEDLEKWLKEEEMRLESKELDGLVKPFKLEILKNHTFRQSGPAIVGVDILGGTLKSNTQITKDGTKLGVVKEIQLEGDNVNKADEGRQVAISLPNLTVGRQIKEGDILYSDIPPSDFRVLKTLQKYLNDKEVKILKEIAKIKRNENPVWGI
ncbi:translation initiation factor IF-2 [archaeon]|jgi:translation initiation factor 5B|nr:translation initiation factor IF-2 [archaeon]MBT6824341.1 translation initiation factor IF-2 [archaeon]MBT7106891.1 translation initiation factor IF-2 [archaeon]MBT7297444.1 translation initiation factor IF-2 [archaeon]